MTPGITVDGPSVDANLVLEEVARVLSAEGKDAANVTNSRGKLLGSITLSDLIAAMVPPKVDVAT
jgi:glycine betaine/proline transport system ATP-binding protein